MEEFKVIHETGDGSFHSVVQSIECAASYIELDKGQIKPVMKKLLFEALKWRWRSGLGEITGTFTWSLFNSSPYSPINASLKLELDFGSGQSSNSWLMELARKKVEVE